MDKAESEKFREAVYDIVMLIPRGRATSYGAIARATGHANMSRLVGKVMGSIDAGRTDIPAHRVVNSSGYLTAKRAFGPGDTLRAMLVEEGITIAGNKITNWKTIFWDPQSEISI